MKSKEIVHPLVQAMYKHCGIILIFWSGILIFVPGMLMILFTYDLSGDGSICSEDAAQ